MKGMSGLARAGLWVAVTWGLVLVAMAWGRLVGDVPANLMLGATILTGTIAYGVALRSWVRQALA